MKPVSRLRHIHQRCVVCLKLAYFALGSVLSRDATRSAAPDRVLQAYNLLCIDMPGEEAGLAAAVPPGLLDVARARWAHSIETEQRVRCNLLCIKITVACQNRPTHCNTMRRGVLLWGTATFLLDVLGHLISHKITY